MYLQLFVKTLADSQQGLLRRFGDLRLPSLVNIKLHSKDMARLLPARSLHLSAASVHHSGAKELSGRKGTTEAATEAVCRSVPEY